MFLNQFISTFSNRKQSVKFQELELSTDKNLSSTILQNTIANLGRFAS